MRPLLSLTREQFRQEVAELGGSPRHADRIRRRLLGGLDPLAEQHGGFPPSQALLEAVAERFTWSSMQVVEASSADDGSQKLLLQLADDSAVEAVRMPGNEAPSACVSSQVGCAMACTFCASGVEGVRRNLTSQEILEQLVAVRQVGAAERLVFMGAGEPTQNLPAILDTLPILRDEASIGARHIIISTVGPPSAIDRLTEAGFKFTVALSLHTLDRELRGEIVPTQAHIEPLALLDAVERFRQATGRSPQLAVTLLRGLNDGRADARSLAKAIAGRRMHVSVIPWNHVDGMPYERPPERVVRAYMEVLHDEGVSCAVRRTVGADASGACGQLRARSAIGYEA